MIRRLLFEGYTAPALLKMLAGKTEAEYEAVLAGGVSTKAAAGPRDEPDAAGSSGTLRLVHDLTPDEPPSVSPAKETFPWRRVEIAPGLELHVRADFAAPDTHAGRESLLSAVLANLPRRGRP